MKIKKLLVMTTVVVSMLLFVSCGSSKSEIQIEAEIENVSLGNMSSISDKLYYDNDTKIVYYYKSRTGGFSHLSPYYSENGKLCKYNQSTKQIEELIVE